ncbi:MAG TPA: YesL family protein [Clostridiales bacterium]|jgi:uncharacterized membrane protein YesL|nr:YesL family protein [Clostridiales bacterium]
MNNIFNLDNPFFTALGKICDMIVLSLLYLIVCLPIITIGPASTALYYTVVKVIRRGRSYIFREFFKSFKLNFKRGAIVGAILTIIFVVLYFDLIFAYGISSPDNSTGSLMMGLFIGLTFLTVAFSVYVFPVLSRFDMTVKQLARAAAFMSLRHLLFTVLMILVNAASIIIVYIFFPFVFIAPALSVFVNSFMMERIFKKYMPESEGPGEVTGKDEWYLE